MTGVRTVTSADGTTVAFEQRGSGAPIVVVAGAMCDRAKIRPTAEALSRYFTVYSYDRRGRGDSGDTAPYAVQREIEDLAAVVEAAGGSAAAYGHSSGGALTLYAAADGVPLSGVVVHEPPFGRDEPEARATARASAERIRDLVEADRLDDAVQAFMAGTGASDEEFAQWRTEDWWKDLARSAHTLVYESAIMRDLDGAVVPRTELAAVEVPTLVMTGAESPEEMAEAGRTVADAVPGAEYRVFAGQDHNPDPDELAKVAAEFLAR